MKKYIIFTYQIHRIGGTQLLTAGKAAYLEKNGWEVYVFTRGESHGESEVPSLTKYISGCGFHELYYRPYKMSDQDRNRVLDRMVEILRIDETIENEIIIESHYDVVAYWAELLAERIHARHFTFMHDEEFRGPLRFYEENLVFFYFKHLRREFLVGSDRLFNGYRNFTNRLYDELPYELNYGCEPEPIQGVDNPDVDTILAETKADYTIAYIGRIKKSYVPAVFRGVAEFARKYSDKTIRLIIVGKTENADQLSMFAGISNINIVLLGILVPIPKSLFSQIDAVVAGAQTAIFCAEEKVPVISTIIGSDETFGVLYCDGNDPWYGYDYPDHAAPRIPPRMSYCEAFEKVLIRKEYVNRKLNIPPRKPAEWHYEQTLIWQRKNPFPLEYFTEKFKLDLRRDWIAIFPFKYIERGTKIVLYGMNEICKDYIHQMEGYCELVAIVADNHEHYDKTILAPEKLRELNFDAIVIAEYSIATRINAIVDNIIRLVGKRNIVYNWDSIRAI